jgi:hypothetical protein
VYALVSISVLPDQPLSWFTWDDAAREYASSAAPLWVFQYLSNHPRTSNRDPSSIYPDLSTFDLPAPILSRSLINSVSDDSSDDLDAYITEEEEDIDARTDSYISSPSSSHDRASSTAFSPSPPSSSPIPPLTSSSSPIPRLALNRYNSVRQRTIYDTAERYMMHLELSASYRSAIRAVCRALGDDRQALYESLLPFFEYLPHGEEEIEAFLDCYLEGFETDWDLYG